MFFDCQQIFPVGALVSSVASIKDNAQLQLKWNTIDVPSSSSSLSSANASSKSISIEFSLTLNEWTLRYLTWFLSCLFVLLFPWPNTTIQRTFIHGISISMLISSFVNFQFNQFSFGKFLVSKEWLLLWGTIHGLTHVIWPFVDGIVGANQDITPFYDITVHLSMTVVHYAALKMISNKDDKSKEEISFSKNVFQCLLIFINIVNVFNVIYLGLVDLNLFGYYDNEHKFYWADDNLFGNTAGITTIGYALWIPFCLWHNKWNDKNYYIHSILFVLITIIIYGLFRMDHDNIAFAMKYCFIDAMMIVCIWPLWYPICQ